MTARPSHMRVADRVIEMRGGMIVADGKPEIIVPNILMQMASSARANEDGMSATTEDQERAGSQTRTG